MRLAALVFSATVLPLAWGWAVYRLMKWLWPGHGSAPVAERPPAPPSMENDFQI